MPDDTSVVTAFALLWLIGALRGAATYAVGRGARRAGEGREAAERLFARPGMVRAQQVVGRWGAPAVAASYLALGLQTAACLAAGLLRVRLAPALVAVVVGAALRAALYVLVGVAVVVAWLSGPVGPWVVGGLAVVALVTVLVRRRRA
ncbi:hypothetical protein [Nocardioides marmoraquaticus]